MERKDYCTEEGESNHNRKDPKKGKATIKIIEAVSIICRIRIDKSG